MPLVMPYILTLVASENNLAAAHIADVTNYCAANGLELGGVPDWLGAKKAAAIPLKQRPARKDIEALWRVLEEDRIDLFIAPAIGSRRKKLLLADMDATIVTGETLDEIAALAGIGDEVAAITRRAMAGELDFKAALRERVAMLKGRNAALLNDALEKLELSNGARALVQGMSESGATCVLVSGGFTFFTEKIAALAGFHHHHGNILEINDNKLCGTVEEPILDRDSKLKLLQQYAQQLKLDLSETMAIGDGANDLPMLQAAGLGIGYHPKPLLRATLDNCILYGDLTAALFAQGHRGTNANKHQ